MSEIPYDDRLVLVLEERGTGILAAGAPLVVEIDDDVGRYNACLRFALLHGLEYDYEPGPRGVFTVYPPAGSQTSTPPVRTGASERVRPEASISSPSESSSAV